MLQITGQFILRPVEFLFILSNLKLENAISWFMIVSFTKQYFVLEAK